MSEPIDLSKFVLEKVINESPHLKTVTLQGLYDGKLMIVHLEKKKFFEKDLKQALSDSNTKAIKEFNNDIYNQYTIKPVDMLNDIQAVIIREPSDTILAKYTKGQAIFFTETPEIYEKFVNPFINKLKEEEKTRDNWVYNILEGRSEVDRVILNEPDPVSGFMLVNSLKWGGDQDDLHAMAICHRRDIRCIRDLGPEHLELLDKILVKGTAAIKEKFKDLKYPIRVYIHYQPTYYHFHVHFRAQNPEDYQSTDRDNPLPIVIDNIRLYGDYYKKSTMYYQLASNSALYRVLEDGGCI